MFFPQAAVKLCLQLFFFIKSCNRLKLILKILSIVSILENTVSGLGYIEVNILRLVNNKM
jgi:hypothetical protein